MNIELNVFENSSFSITIWQFSTLSLLGMFFFFLKNPEKFEKFVALVAKVLNYITHKFDKEYIKYDLQGKINSYVKQISKKVKHLNVSKVLIKWVDAENITSESFMRDGELIIRLHKSDNQNKNIVNASMAFISHAFLKKAKSYISKYQKESLDIYACYDLLKSEKSEILDQFVQDFMKDKMDNNKIAELFEKYDNINKSGIFYPILVQELTFLGEKVFNKKRNPDLIYEEVKQLILYLNNYANRKFREDIISDFTGAYCKFAIRIIGRQYKVSGQGERVYTNNICKINSGNETLYLIGNIENKKFITNVFNICKERIGYSILTEESYSAYIKDTEGNDYMVRNYLLILRSNKIQVYHK